MQTFSVIEQIDPDMVILCDSNEKVLPFKRAKTERKKLYFGNTRYSVDYMCKGVDKIAIEYKSQPDLYMSLGRNHDKFFKKMRLMIESFKYPYLVVGANAGEIMTGCVTYKAQGWQRMLRATTQLHPGSILGGLVMLAEEGVRVRFCKNPQHAAYQIEHILDDYLKFKGKRNG